MTDLRYAASQNMGANYVRQYTVLEPFEADYARQYAVLEPAWPTLSAILSERRISLLESLRQNSRDQHDHWSGRIAEIDETILILERLGQLINHPKMANEGNSL